MKEYLDTPQACAAPSVAQNSIYERELAYNLALQTCQLEAHLHAQSINVVDKAKEIYAFLTSETIDGNTP